MKKIDLGQTISILANVGVIAGLLFLALQIRQNTAQMRAEAAYAINQSVESINEAVYQDREFAELLVRGEQSFDNLDPIEQRRLLAYYFTEINLADYIIRLENEGLADLHFRYVDYKIDQFNSSIGRGEFVDSVLSVDDGGRYFGSAELYRRLVDD